MRMTCFCWQALGKLLLGAEAANTISILIFHRVLPARDPLRPGTPDAAAFRRIVRFLARNFRVRPLHEAFVEQRRNGLSGHTVAITFDDGYADNLTVALPVLREYRAPATFFVTSGFLDGGMMWNDKVIESFRSHDGAVLDARPVGLERYDTSDRRSRAAAIRSVISNLKYKSDTERHEIASWLMKSGNVVLRDNLMLTTEQLRELARDPIAEIGGHTVSHPILKRLAPAEARREIEGGKRDLESILGGEVRSFAYPNGIPDVDYGAEHVRIVAETGFDLAVSTSWGAAGADADRFQLPRFTPWDEQMGLFGIRLLTAARREHAVATG